MITALVVLALSAAPADSAPARLIGEIDAHSNLLSDIEALCDGIGPRLSGSEGLHRAQTWAMTKLTEAGASNVHLEPFSLGVPWRRGVERARLVNANGRAFEVAQWGWTEGTAGAVRGPVVVVDAPTLAELQAAAPHLRGKVVLVRSRPKAIGAERANLADFRARVAKVWHSAHVAAVLVPSERAAGLLDMAGAPDASLRERTAFISKDQAALFARLIGQGFTPEVEVTLGGGFGRQPVVESNVVAELPGDERADEVVILGAHLDSWDLGPGAADNGAGVVAFIEVMRAFHALGLKPRRTLRVVLFAGEEQGLLGSKAYVTAHSHELERIHAVFVLDGGAGKITTLGDGQVDAWAEALQEALKPTEALGQVDIEYARAAGSDQETFRAAGVPTFGARQEPGDYWSLRHHTKHDTVDGIDADSLKQATQVSAVLAWGLVTGTELPHVAPDVETPP